MRPQYFGFIALSATGLLLGLGSPRPAALAAFAAAGAANPATPPASGANSAAFDSTIKPLFAKSCVPCHNERMASGSLDLQAFGAISSISAHRDQWERIVQKI